MAKPVDDTTLERQPTMEPPAAPRGPSAYLLVIAGPSFGEMHRLQGNRSVIGRADTAAIRVLDDGISREHAAVERDGGKNVLVNLGSTNGTFCNGAKVERHELVDGDKISVGASDHRSVPLQPVHLTEARPRDHQQVGTRTTRRCRRLHGWLTLERGVVDGLRHLSGMLTDGNRQSRWAIFRARAE